MNIYHYILAFISSFSVVLLATPSLIKVAKLKHLVDEPSEDRKLHKNSIPTIGGVIIFSAFMFSCFIWFPDNKEIGEYISPFFYLMGSLILLFFVGVKDDIIGTSPSKKLMAHLVVGFILVGMGEIDIDSFYGIFGMDIILPAYAKLIISIFVYIVIVNAINLIDGIDGLAAGVGLIVSITYGIWFYYSGEAHWAIVAFSLAGSLLGFLIFNFNPARIFMGDSGSLTIGAILFVLTVQIISSNTTHLVEPFSHISTPVFVIGVLIYPLLDTLRVFVLRTLKGNSPLSADRKHLHHKLQDKGYGHKKIVSIIYLFNIVSVLLVSLIPIDDPTAQLLILISFSMLFTGVVTLTNRK